jgi:hypothetical protein
VSLSVPMPLDPDGFLRRECPTCERQFKWMAATEEDEGTPQPEGGYYCPYCVIQPLRMLGGHRSSSLLRRTGRCGKWSAPS